VLDRATLLNVELGEIVVPMRVPSIGRRVRNSAAITVGDHCAIPRTIVR
jgi:hypothetical protein